MMMNNKKLKNLILFSTIFIGNIPLFFYGSKYRLNLSLLIERSTRVDFFAMYYVNAINFLILAFCLHFENGIDKRISKFILIMTILDFLHLLLFGMKGFGLAKIAISLFIYFLIKQKNNGENKGYN